MYLALLLVILLGALIVAVFVLAYQPKPTHGLCVECQKPATHELMGDVTHREGFSTAACESYCRRHAPAGAVKV